MKIAVLFPGYGSQFVGMGKELYDKYRIVQEYFEEASNCLGVNFIKLCFASSDSELARIENAYPALFLVSCALYAVVQEMKVVPEVLAGYNQGEFSALCSAGGFSFPDGLYMLNKFCTFYQEVLDTVDVIRVHGLDRVRIEDICRQARLPDQAVFIALYEDMHTFVVAGHTAALIKARELALLDSHVVVESLGPEYGVHAPLIESVVEQFKVYLEKVDFKDMRVPVLSNADGTLLQTGKHVKERIIAHFNRPLMWDAILTTVGQFDIIIEIGPGTTMREMVLKKYPEKKVISINRYADIEELQDIMEKVT